MAFKDRCPRCGALVLPQERFCPQCGARLILDGEALPDAPGEGEPTAPLVEAAVEQPAQTRAEPVYRDGVPANIEALMDFCDENEMPLAKMRFFIDQDYRQPRAFGIYRDGDEFVVYKNKADGSRAVRYHGPDEAFAVGELYAKLLDECHSRDIWPGGKPREVAEAQRKSKRRFALLVVVVAALIVAVAVVGIVMDGRAHRYDGYYRFGMDDTYYRYGDSWYYYDYVDDWVPVDDYPYYDDYGDYYLGDDYDRVWGYSDFRDSETWEDLHEQDHTSSSDYDSWDVGGTDWGSDW